MTKHTEKKRPSKALRNRFMSFTTSLQEEVRAFCIDVINLAPENKSADAVVVTMVYDRVEDSTSTFIKTRKYRHDE